LGHKSKRTFGIGALIIGAILVVSSFVIKAKVTEGEGQIAQAEQNVGKAKGLFGMSSYTKGAGDQLTAGANRKIGEGKDEVAYYTKLANILLFAGIISMAAGGWCLVFGKSSAR